MRKLLFTLLLLDILQASPQGLPTEHVFCHLNTTNFIAGEIIYFSAYVFSGQQSGPSSLLYVELVADDGQAKARIKTKLHAGRGHGNLSIPYDLGTGVYRFIAYTRWMQNEGSRFEQPIALINPYQPKPVYEIEELDSTIVRLNNWITRDSIPKYDSFENVEMVYNVPPGTFSISVNKLHDGFYQNDLHDRFYRKEAYAHDREIPPEVQYGVIQGELKNSQDSVLILTSFQSLQMEVGVGSTDSMGRFTLFYHPDNIQGIGYMAASSNQEGVGSIELFPEYYEDHSSYEKGGIPIDSIMLSGIKERSIQNQLMNSYREENGPGLVAESSFLPTQESRTYLLDEYERFDSMRDTFIEFIFEVAVSKDETDYNLKVRTEPVLGVPRDQIKPLCMLDGIIVSPETILNTNPYAVERIEVLNKLYFFGAYMYDGLVSVHTKKRDFGGVELSGKVLKISPVQKLDYRSIVVRYTGGHKTPSFETLLFWKPDVEHTGGDIEVSFEASESKGIYQIKLFGMNRDGEFIKRSAYFEVK